MAEPRYRRRKEDRPREITAAAFEAFAEKGFEAASTREIAQAADVPICLSFIDYARKRTGIGPLVYATGDVAKDMESLVKKNLKSSKYNDLETLGDFTEPKPPKVHPAGTSVSQKGIIVNNAGVYTLTLSNPGGSGGRYKASVSIK